jgi:hypothetical protein
MGNNVRIGFRKYCLSDAYSDSMTNGLEPCVIDGSLNGDATKTFWGAIYVLRDTIYNFLSSKLCCSVFHSHLPRNSRKLHSTTIPAN